MLAPRANLLASMFLCACGGGNSTPAEAPDEAAAEPTDLGAITVQAPASWTPEEPESSMRKAQWKVTSGSDEASVVVYHFGPGAGGSVDANLQRWYSQFQQPDGSPSADAAEVEKQTPGGMPVTTVDLSGRYVAETRPGSGERVDHPGWRMLAAVIEAPHGSYYVKLVGPQALVEAHSAAFDAFIDSIQASKSR